MQLSRLIARHVRIPLRKPVKHASHERVYTDNLIIECHLSHGIIGYGEGVPRDYVTGETIESTLAVLKASSLEAIVRKPVKTFAEAVELIQQVQFQTTLPDPRGIQANALRCAVELAYLDAAGNCLGNPLSDVTRLIAPSLHDPKSPVRYSVAITSATGWKLKLQAITRKWFGFRQCKVKVGIAGQNDAQRLRTIRRLMGPEMELRVDANEAWRVTEVEQRWREISPFRIAWVEQPVAHEAISQLAKVRGMLNMPVMLDESICGMHDAQGCREEGWGDLFNLRLSKCGGFINSLRLAEFAAQHGFGCQLGCQVGETAILSAAGRHFACSVKGLRALEGSFDRYLVKESLGTADITFARGGLAPALTGPGLGISIDRAALERVTLHQEVILG